MHLPNKINSVFKDTLWSVIGLVLMNVAAQFVVFPVWNRTLGSEAYGNIVFLLGIMNILAVSLGCGVNYARMRKKAEEGETANQPYNILMGVGSGIAVLILLLLKALGLLRIEPLDFVLFCVLTVVTAWRYYADVEYRLHINYKGYFLYYLIIGLGYLGGVLLFRQSGLWALALLPGEVAGLLFVMWKGTIFRPDSDKSCRLDSSVLRLSVLLVGTNVLSGLFFHGDRIILMLFAGSTAVSVFYISSLLGKTMALVSMPLNGVLIGHLARYKGQLTGALMGRITVLTILTIVVASFLCILASMILLPFLYPGDYPVARQYLFLANTAQVIYFTGDVLMASILLRFTHPRNQLVINVFYGVLFIILCVSLTRVFGIIGFCWGLLTANTARLILCLMLGYRGLKEQEAR